MDVIFNGWREVVVHHGFHTLHIEASLRDIETTMEARDRDRHRDCSFYRPSRVPNSINI